MEIILWNVPQRKNGILMKRPLVRRFYATNFLLLNMEMSNVPIIIDIRSGITKNVIFEMK